MLAITSGISRRVLIIVGNRPKLKCPPPRAPVPLANGIDYRIGDARMVLSDIADNSVPLILTDPPYGDTAEPLYEWLADFAARVLVPGGSLICYTGQSRLDRDLAILSSRLRYWWHLAMLHDQSRRLPGKFVIAKPQVGSLVCQGVPARSVIAPGRAEVACPRQGATQL